MSEEAKPCNGWTLPTLYTHLSALLAAQKEAVGLAQSAADKAMLKAEDAANKRFDGVNEFRQTLGDQQRMLMPRTEAEIRFNALDEKVAALEKYNSEKQGRSEGLSIGWQVLLGIAALAGMLFGMLKH